MRLDIIGREKVSLSSPEFDEGIFYQNKECQLSEFDDGIFYQNKECQLSEDSLEIEKRQDWKFPYWKTIQNFPKLCEKPVASGKYSLGGCSYAHDMEENPYILLKREQRELTKTGRQHQARKCTNGVRAWHWYHFEKCAECRLLQGKDPPVLETFKVSIDGESVTVKSSIPSSHPSFKRLLEKLKNPSSTEEAVTELNSPTSPYWIFHASHRDDPRKCTLNYHHVMQEDGHVQSYVQIVVVRSEKFEAYRSFWGKELAIIQLPDELPNCEFGPNEGGVGYARLFIQKMAFGLGLEYIFMIDDNVVVMSEAVTDNPSAAKEKVLRDEKGVMKMKTCSFLKSLAHLQKIAQGKDTPPLDEKKFEPHPLTEEFKSQEVPLYTYTGPAKLFGNKKHESYGVLGLLRSKPVAVNPFLKTQVYAVILLNIKSTVEKGVFYRPWPCWEDLRFNDDCDKAGLWVVKCNRYHFLKVQFKDWIHNLALLRIFKWNNYCTLEDRPCANRSELPKELEEDIILEHLRNFVNIQGGPEKCFKDSIGHNPGEESEDTISPTRIVKRVKASEITDEASTFDIPALILSYCVSNRRAKYMNRLNSRFCNTKEKIVFVTSAMEAMKRWPQVTLSTIRAKDGSGICLFSDIEDRNAEFEILSAADPRRHRLRYILIEASLPQCETTDEDVANSIKEATRSTGNNQADTRNEPNVEEITSSGRVHTSSRNKGVKRPIQEPSNKSAQSKRRKLKGFFREEEDIIPATGTDEVSYGPNITKPTIKDKSKRKRKSTSVNIMEGKGSSPDTSHADSESQKSGEVKIAKPWANADEVQHKKKRA